MAQTEHDLRILEALEQNPDLTQANLAAQLGVAVGSVNWYLKRLIKKGYIKVTQLQRRKLKYFVTPEGLALKAKLTSQYMKASLRVYRELRQAAREALSQVRLEGYGEVAVDGKDEASEILRLTCLEEGIEVHDRDGAVPRIWAEGTRFEIDWPDEQ